MVHLSELRFTTRPVIPMDMDGLRWIPTDPIGFHSTSGYRLIPSDSISALHDFHLTSGTLSRQSYLTSAGGCLEYNFAYSIGKLRFSLVCIENVWQRVDIYLFYVLAA